jgi:Bacterial Ig domain
VSVLALPQTNPPVASDNTSTTDQGVAVTIDVLANDNDPDNDPLTIQSVTSPTTNGGTAVIESGGKIKYTLPSDTFTGTDTFDYAVSDGKEGGTDTATVTVTVEETQPSDTTPPVIEATVDGTKGNNYLELTDRERLDVRIMPLSEIREIFFDAMEGADGVSDTSDIILSCQRDGISADES